MPEVVREMPKHKFKRKYTRETAARHLQAFLGRVTEYNADPEMPHTILWVVLFGSYRRGAEKVGDVDLIVDYQNKPDYSQLARARVSWAVSQGKHFVGLEDVFWPHREMMLFLKAGSPVLSFYGQSDLPMALAEGGVYLVKLGKVLAGSGQT